MKLAIYDKTGKKTGDVEFSLEVPVREDIFKRAVLAENSLFHQEQGADPQAGKKHAIHLSKRRRKFRTTYGRGQARTPKKVMWARGRQLRFVGAFAPNTVGGRRAHPPKADKNTLKMINNREWLKALQVGLSSSMNNELVSKNGQRVPQNYPFVIDESVETMNKTKDVTELFQKLGLTEELERTSERKVRAGRGKMRNRTYRTKRGPLLIVSSIEAPILKAARNIKGLDIVTPDVLMVSDFGMSEKPGRVTIFSKAALEEFKEVYN